MGAGLVRSGRGGGDEISRLFSGFAQGVTVGELGQMAMADSGAARRAPHGSVETGRKGLGLAGGGGQLVGLGKQES